MLSHRIFAKEYFISKKNIIEIEKSKKFLVKELTKLNIKFINTHANFFHIELGENIEKLEKKFKKKGILCLEKAQE